ncbi:MAG TPA: methylenetetrahydrofolate reductase, partial [Candidatus Baltobacteraceae bacterium]|nr:methylenetetrahydrofolate reductase [Candidatus Baltobacteraceae bacterium]
MEKDNRATPLTDISLELVPRSVAQLQADARLVKDKFPRITMVNVPDVLRLPVRSWHACSAVRGIFSRAIPHLRAMDIPLTEKSDILNEVRTLGLREVLVVGGDAPHDLKHLSYPTGSIDLIRWLKREFTDIKVFGAVDPYRQSLRGEMEYVRRKADAGADGFFTQPVFDLRLLEIYAEALSHWHIFWGITPIVTDGARSYWETTNNVVLPKDFNQTMEWNQTLARA